MTGFGLFCLALAVAYFGERVESGLHAIAEQLRAKR
jgi:hypothetical protein